MTELFIPLGMFFLGVVFGFVAAAVSDTRVERQIERKVSEIEQRLREAG